MEAKFNTLPPNKRFRLMQQQEQQPNNNLNHFNSSHLPAKKRKESRDLGPPNPIPAVNLPTKKRIWAFHPDLDLNVEYKPPIEQNPNAKISPKKTNPQIENDDNDEIVEYKPPIEQNHNPKIGPKKTNPQIENEDDDDDGIVCAVCDSTDGDPSDPIVFCDGCDLMVHSFCYGSPLINSIPEGDWFCTQCMNKGETFSCSLCPNSNGPMKPTKDGKWAHILCALLVPEVFFLDPEGREGIDCSRVPKRRYEKGCYVCERLNGCVVDCSELNCELSFHVSCGFDEDLCIEYRDLGKKKGGVVAAFCKEHTELWSKQQKTGKFKIVARD